MNFANAIRNESAKTHTENGATAISTTGSPLLDLFGSAGSLRTADDTRIERLFVDACKENPLLATKAMFYIRDVRGGLGERRTFRVMLRYAAKNHPECVRENISLIPFYGRYDDLYALLDTPLEKVMWHYIRDWLDNDRDNMMRNKPCSLLAKWLKTADASSPKTRKLGIRTAAGLGMSVYDYKRLVRQLRKYIDVTEVKMSGSKWSDIRYESVPSRAMLNYRKAFARHDGDRYQGYINAAMNGEAKIHSDTLFPYDIIEKYWAQSHIHYGPMFTCDPVLEAQWKALPNYVDGDANAMVIADTSGSMYGRPLYSAVGLAIYFAQRNRGAYHNLWMSFSGDSRVNSLKGENLAQILSSIDYGHWGNNTNMERAFTNILRIAKENHVPPEEMVKSIIVISDMEFDICGGKNWLFYDEMRDRFTAAGYEIPNVVFWNVNSRHDIFHADKNRKGVQLCSGQSASTFKTLMKSVGMTPMEMMLYVLNSERYSAVTIS